MKVVPIYRSMWKTRILLSISVGTLVYVLISVLGGQNGVWAMNQLKEQRQNISINKAEIERINEELILEYTALRNDMDVVAAYARRLGFVGEGELLVKISGLPTYYTTMYDAGTIMRQSEIKFISELVAKVCGCVVAVLMLVLLVLRDLSKGRISFVRSRPTYEAGLHVGGYDASSTTTYL